MHSRNEHNNIKSFVDVLSSGSRDGNEWEIEHQSSGPLLDTISTRSSRLKQSEVDLLDFLTYEAGRRRDVRTVRTPNL